MNMWNAVRSGMAACIFAAVCLAAGCASSETTHPPAAASAITAIDILLEPDATMVGRAEAVNARLRGVYPKGFALDASHRPHISMYQCFVPTEKLDHVYAAAERVFAGGRVTAIRLEAFKYYYIPDGELGLSGIVIKRTPQLDQLQADLIAAVSPLTVKTATSAAFVTGDKPVISPLLIEYVEVFATRHAGEHFEPHVTTGLAPRTYLDRMLAEPFDTFTFSPAGAAVYHLGHYGAAAHRLKSLELKP